MRSILTQAAVIIGVAAAVGGYFAYTRPPTLGSSKGPSDAAPPAAGTTKSPDKPLAGTPADQNNKKPDPGMKTDPAKPKDPVPKTSEPPAKPEPKAVPAASAAPTKPDAKADRHISLERAKKLFDDQALDGRSVFFVDAREYWHYTDQHVTGAMHIDKKYFDGAAPKKVLDYLPGNAVVVYCMGADCSDSEAVATRLEALNLNIGPIFIMKDGLPGWVSAGYPTAKGGEVGFP